jgi:hypothetical protein
VKVITSYGKMELQLHAFLTAALDTGEWPASRPDGFTPGEELLVPAETTHTHKHELQVCREVTERSEVMQFRKGP